MDVHTLEKNIVNKVRGKVDSVMTTVATGVQDAILTAKENMVIAKVEQAMKTANASSGRVVESIVPDPDNRDFSGKFVYLWMTALKRINFNLDTKKIVKTRGIFTVEGGDLSVNKKNFQRQTQGHHNKGKTFYNN